MRKSHSVAILIRKPTDLRARRQHGGPACWSNDQQWTSIRTFSNATNRAEIVMAVYLIGLNRQKQRTPSRMLDLDYDDSWVANVPEVIGGYTVIRVTTPETEDSSGGQIDNFSRNPEVLGRIPVSPT